MLCIVEVDFVANKPRPSDEIIRLTVTHCAGDTNVLSVHRGVLCQSSEFYQSVMKPEWIQLREQPDIVGLFEDSLQAATDYIRWLYSNRISIRLYNAGEDARDRRAEEAEKVFVLLAEAYVFGEKIIDVKYKNEVLKTVFKAKKSSDWNMGPESVKIIYGGTPAGSPLRRLVADSIAHKAHDDSQEGVGWMQFCDNTPEKLW
jgi:hypothetical protein